LKNPIQFGWGFLFLYDFGKKLFKVFILALEDSAEAFVLLLSK